MAQLVERLPSTQNVAGLNPSSFFLLRKKELSLGVVDLLCLVSLTEFTCICLLTVFMQDSAVYTSNYM